MPDSRVPPAPRADSQVPHNLGRTAGRGLLWMMMQTIGVKGVSLIANIVIARFIAPDDAGLVSMAYTVLSIAGIVQFIGMQDVLVQRQANFRRWASAAFWMALAVGLAGGALVAISAPLAARFYGEPRLVGMVLLLACASPLTAISIVPQAMLAAQLRFRMSVVVSTIAAVSTSLMSMALAWRGLGAYSVLIPVPIVALAQAIALWSVARPRIARSLHWRRWRFLLGDTGLNWGIAVCLIVITTADHVVLGRLFPKDVLGIYFWAVNLSTQLLRLLSTNLMSVLLPSLSRLQDHPERQTMAFVQATRVLTLIGIPACLLQAALAEPLVRILYRQSWEGVGPVLEALSVGMAFNFVAGPATSMMKAQGRFGAAFYLSLVHAITMVVVVILAARWTSPSQAAMHMAVAVAACLGGFGPLYLAAALKGSPQRLAQTVRVFATPTLASVLSIGAAVGVAHFVPPMANRDWALVVVTTIITTVLYPLLVRWLDREIWDIAIIRLRSLRPATPQS